MIGKPYEAYYAAARNAVRANFKQFTLAYEGELIKLYALQFMKPSKVGVVEVMIQTVTGLNFHAVQAPDRLGSDKIDFPIGLVYSDRDWNGSDGADALIK